MFFLLMLGAGNVEAAALTGASVSFEEKVKQFAAAVAFAEGFWDRDGNVQTENVPARFHNPGDLSPGDAPGYSSTYTDGSNVAQFPDDNTGWQFLYKKVRRILTGRSSVNGGKGIQATIADVASKYAEDSVNWANNVASYLSIDGNTTLEAWLNG